MALGLVVVEVCEQNILAAHSIDELEQENPEVAVLRTQCLFMCHMCRAVPYAMVNQKRVYAKRLDQCFGLLKETIEEEIVAFFDES
ncbi:hypothetical protein BRE01_41300 [Brevibacillus reuszeri]|uniref:DUF1450 domain-containing protein n=1 Tax=Brevibacillus reuszeri TaxID=54915 RepID=A0A0K9YWE0_9BACL|nr:DUF1450 domain-containing protein [Brevibacillus reuszeri]KNB72560.1 hypothetical protein ADS79_11910 [Brevibacillus reuszeri]MED1860759.1 DUF1450 domain-containing protein [Brevibacillus reuszeri]GED70428.1 hypothetical protein BRE01_41300 [Brevibacillus reuszeri]